MSHGPMASSRRGQRSCSEVMIAEFAIDPEVMARWDEFTKIWRDFGIAQRRQIGLYPKKWKRSVADRSQELVQSKINTEMQRARIIERLSGDAYKNRYKKVNCTDWLEEQSWLMNAMSHEPKFRAIVTRASIADDRVLDVNDMIGDCGDSGPYHLEPDDEINRSVDGILSAILPLLEQSDTVILVEPNFDPREIRFRNVMEAIIDSLNAIGKVPKRFELHTAKTKQIDGHVSNRFHDFHFTQNLGPLLRSGWSLKVGCWMETRVEDYLHPRFVITEVGAIHIDWGLDEGHQAGIKTIAKGLGDATHQRLWERFSVSSSAFLSDSENECIEVS